MKIFIGQISITTVLTELSLIFPVHIYSTTHSILLLGIVITIYNASNALGAYVWGNILDGTHRRFEFVLLLPLSILAILPLIFSGNLLLEIIAYGLLGFFTALDSPLYSLLVLENFSYDEMLKANSRLSQMSLLGNIIGSVIASFNPNFYVLLVILLSSIISGILFNRNVKGQINKNKEERVKDIRNLYSALFSFFAFNLAAEIFFVLYIPVNYLMNNPEYVIFISYALLYGLNEFIYSLALKIVRNYEAYYIYFTIFARNILSLSISLIILIKINVGLGVIPLFLIFGMMYPIYSTAFFSLVFRGLRRNRATILGIFNSAGDIANILGSLLTGFVGENNLWGAYLVSFYTFTLSAFLMARHLKLPISSKS